MNTPDEHCRMRALPTQLIPISSGTVIRRDRTEIIVEGERWGELILQIFSILRRRPSSVTELLSLFDPSVQNRIREFLYGLIEHRILVPETGFDDQEETREDVFYWNFGLSRQERVDRAASFRLVVVGINSISLEIAASLRSWPVHDLLIIDEPQLRNPDAVDLAKRQQLEIVAHAPESWPEAPSLILACSEFGDKSQLLSWNDRTLAEGIPFLPVLERNYVGSVGPIVDPYESACFNCLLHRQNSNLDDWETMRVIDEAASQGRTVTGLLPSMAKLIASIASIELLKFLMKLPGRKVGAQFEVRPLESRHNCNSVLKIPRCPSCSPLERRPTTGARISDFYDSPHRR